MAGRSRRSGSRAAKSTTPEPSPTPPRRHGERWENAEDRQLVEELRAGVTVEDIAREHQRTGGGITSRIKLMLPRDEAIRGAQAADWLREALAEGYAWESVIEANVELDGGRYWREEYDNQLRQGWAAAMPLPQLARLIGGDELQVVRRLITLGLAESLMEVTDRLGYTLDGPVALRRQLAVDSSAAAVYVLLVDVPSEPQHVSIHPSKSDAEGLRDFLIEEDPRPEYFWRVVLRWPGSGTKGRVWTHDERGGLGEREEPP